MMYLVHVRETLSHVVYVEADDEEQAEELVWDRFCNWDYDEITSEYQEVTDIEADY